jgi:glucosamine--fructose-6-phosphate aminotransferase (isomerizing)
MCGIVGYIGDKEPTKVVLEGLKRLEYRGYDSAGLATLRGGNINITRAVGSVDKLEMINIIEKNDNKRICIGHTRWATHGAPEERNSHPHRSNDHSIALVHNGIIENYETLKKKLIEEGFHFYSDTDTEVLVNWIQYKRQDGENLLNAVQRGLRDVVGAYAIVVIDDNGNQVVCARKSSPLAIGVNDGEFIIASDATPIIPYTRDVIYLEDDNIAVIDMHGIAGNKPEITITNKDNDRLEANVEHVDMELDAIEKGGFDSFMMKEIYEQPDTVMNCLRGRLTDGEGPIMMGGVENIMPNMLRARRIYIIACGTSWHAGLIGKTMIEKLVRIPVEVDYASEFRYRDPVIKQGDVVIAVSQSGETADTRAALEMAKDKGASLFGIVNVVGSSIARMVDAGIYTHSGVEIGVASTKAFTGQVAAFALLAIKMAWQLNTITEDRYVAIKRSLANIPEKIAKTLESADKVFEIADVFSDDKFDDFLYLGRGINFPAALEGALKLKEISYVHAEGYPAGEMKHGPIALIDETCPSVFVAPADKSYDKILSNMQEVKARGGKVIAIVTKDDMVMSRLADYTIEIDSTDELFTPMLSVIPLQLLAYRIAKNKGLDVDKPRNLAKSVTVE